MRRERAPQRPPLPGDDETPPWRRRRRVQTGESGACLFQLGLISFGASSVFFLGSWRERSQSEVKCRARPPRLSFSFPGVPGL